MDGVIFWHLHPHVDQKEGTFPSSSSHTHMRTATKKHRFRHKIPNKLGIFKRV